MPIKEGTPTAISFINLHLGSFHFYQVMCRCRGRLFIIYACERLYARELYFILQQLLPRIIFTM